ncbi:hypothetical protein ACQEU3_29425 [Spirillospora sp. CA-253888]
MSEDGGPLAWCVVANVAPEVPFGPGGLELRRGTRHFSPGTRVWVLPPQWGDGGEQVYVIGRHRGSRRLVRLVMRRDRLVSFRARGVYSPAVLRLLTGEDEARGGPMFVSWTSREEVERAAAHWRATCGR